MYEVEVKVRASHDAVRERLVELDADQIDEVVQEDVYYDAPHRDFAETDEAFRLRREREDGDEDVRMTYKGPLVEAESKTRKEFETGVDEGETAENVFEALGFSPAATVRKERERFALDGYVVTLDAVDGLGEFVEVETETENDVESAREGAYDVLRTLNLDPGEQIRTSYLGLLLSDDASE
ncbi:class IV adenylate cyclase [Haloarculaceae archaeon H-GB2-1]|nr:class IV adenylate cyclase [Haloarculaceae archaeon H-GB1-1]MEA5386633.1 class IV adenylate cyclase [Haloarculaceae archaeon H-GB11]MEA5408157.1 class IV adenylate cyclase [Haloarculaceae archaeon H-GB2-1]